MALNWGTTDNVAVNGVKILTYGAAGSLKTRLVASLPNPLLISAENGMLSLRDFKLPYLEIKEYADIFDAYKFVTQSAEARRFESIAIDSVSELAERVLEKHMPKYKDPRKAYGAMLDEMIPMLKAFRDLKGKHIYVTAKQAINVNEDGAVTTIGPDAPGRKLGPLMPFLFDEVFQAQRIQDNPTMPARFMLRTARDYLHEAKDRSGALDPNGELADLGAIIRKILSAVPGAQPLPVAIPMPLPLSAVA